VVPRGGLTKHHNGWGALAVRVGENPPAAHGNAERLEVIGGYDLHVEHRVGVSLLLGLSFGCWLTVPPAGAGEWDRHDGRGTAHTGDRPHLRQQSLEQRTLFRRSVEPIVAKRQVADQQV